MSAHIHRPSSISLTVRQLGIAATCSILSISAVWAEEFSTDASWKSGNTHNWTLTKNDPAALVIQSSERASQLSNATVQNDNMVTPNSEMGEIRFSVKLTSQDDGTITGDKAPRLLRPQLAANPWNNLPSSDWVIETAIMQKDPNNLDVFHNPSSYPGAFYPTGHSGATNSHAGLVLWVDSQNWLMWGQANNQTMWATGYIAGAVINIPLQYPYPSQYTLYQYFRIRKSTRDSNSPPTYFFEASGETTSSDTYTSPSPQNHPGGRYGWVSLGSWTDIGYTFGSAQYGLMARTYGSSGSNFNVQFGYFFENVPVVERDDFTSNYFAAPPYTYGPYQVTQGTSSTAMVVTTLPFSDPSVAYSNLQFTVAAGDVFTPINGYHAPTVLKTPKYPNWIIDTKIINPPSGKSVTGLLVDTPNHVSWMHLGIFPGATPSPVTNVSGVINGQYKSVLTGDGSIPLTLPGIYTYLRIGKLNNTYRFAASNDAITWTSFPDTLTVSLTSPTYGLMAAATSGGPGFITDFDFFREYPQPNGLVQHIVGATEIVRLIGGPILHFPNSLNPPPGVDLNNGDLGSMAELGSPNSTVYMMFGDNQNSSGVHQSNAIGRSSDSQAQQESNGVDFHGALVSNPIPIVGTRTDTGNVTNIPTSGVGVPSVAMLFYQYMWVYHWSVAASHWDANGSRLAQSPDGINFTTLNGGALAWLPDSNFVQVAMALDSAKTTAYIFGIPAGGYGNVQVAKVAASSLGNPALYQYYNGTGWSAGESTAKTIVQGPIREFSVQYCPALGEWLMMGTDDNTRNIVLREAANPEGPWYSEITAVDNDSSLATAENVFPNTSVHPQSYIYGGYMTPKFIDGLDIYFTMTKFKDYNVYWDKITLSTVP